MKYVPPIGEYGDAPYRNFNPAQAVDGSIVSAEAVEHPMREIVNAIIGLGGDPSENELDQLAKLLKLKFDKGGHSHDIDDVDGLARALDDKAALDHKHDELSAHVRDKNNPHETGIKDIPGLTDALDGKADVGHTHGGGIGDSDIQSAIDRALKGLIAIWSGTVDTIPSGWALCDGENGTPDLRDKFVVGAGGAYQANTAGGAGSHSHDISGTGTVGATTLTVVQMPAHTHTYTSNPTVYGAIGNEEKGTVFQVVKTPAIATSSTGGGEAHGHSFTMDGISLGNTPNLPPYYALAFIMKL